MKFFSKKLVTYAEKLIMGYQIRESPDHSNENHYHGKL